MNSPSRQRASALLLKTLQDWPHPTITAHDMGEALAERAYGAVLLLFALLNCLPLPGVGMILGPILVLYALQSIIMPDAQPWLPPFIARHAFNRDRLRRALVRALPALRFVERLSRPRLQGVVTPLGKNILAIWIAVLGVCITLPLWGSNLLPGVGAVLIAIAMMEEDGLLALIGAVIGLLGLLLILGLLTGGAHLLEKLL